MPYEDTALGGNSGTSGLVANHDDSLVSVQKEVGGRRKKYAVVCPHAGKTFCFPEFRKTLYQLPLNECHVVLYDNSQSKKHSAKLNTLSRALPSFTLIKDDNKPESIESSMDFRVIVARCSAVYQHIYENHLPKKSDYVINLEDDVFAPPGGFNRLKGVLDTYDDVGTVVGNCRDRRVKVMNGEAQPIAVNFRKTQKIGGTGKVQYEVMGVHEKEFGVEWIGAAHMGLWLARRECVDLVGMQTVPEGRGMPIGHDIQYGLRLNESGWKFAVDWSVKLDHYYMQNGEVLSV